jgi:formylglycine-generating enzyme required for sulfatase activity
LTVELIVREPLGERSFAAGDFPLSIGGEGSDVLVPTRSPGPLAWIADHDGQVFVQPSGDEAVVLHNGSRISGSTWLRGGDVLDVGGGRLKLRVDDGRRVLDLLAGGVGNVTAPPVAAPSASVSGEGADEGERIDAVAFRPPVARARPARWSTRRSVIAVSAAALALVATLVFTSTPVEVVIDPAPERLAFEGGWPGLKLGSSHLLRPGTYTLVAERAGYARLSVPVTVSRDSGQVLRYRLTALPGHLRIVLPVPGTVTIDGRAAGKVPGEFALAAGDHAISIDTERYLDYTARIRVQGFGKREQIAPKLTPAWATVRIATEPAGAEVRVAGHPRGTTPLVMDLMAGSHRVELLHPGFKPWVSDVQVKANQPLTIGPVKLGLPDGRLAVRSRPAGASVTIGGAYRGRTPLEVDVRPELTQTVSITRDGYEPASREVTVGAGRSAAVEVTLAPILGDVIVNANPKDAELLVDGESKGLASQTLRLPATRHAIEIRRPGYLPFRSTVTPRPGLPQSVEVTLLEGVAPASVASQSAGGAGPAGAPGTAGAAGSTPAPTGLVALTPTLRAKSGQELRLAPAGEFTMGSPRREAGRRANESQRLVRLERRFYVATRETTNAEYRQFRAEHRSGFVLQNSLELDRQPVVNVSWQEAAAYCNWLSAQEGLAPAYEMKGGSFVPVVPATSGYRLPTEAEWEWIARRDGAGLRKYPWGEALPVPPGAGNYADRSAQALLPNVMADYEDGYAATAPTGSFAANPAGYFDLGGNVAEWTHDLYTVQPRSDAAAVDPAATGEGALHVIRGSSWKSGAVTELRLAYRDYGDGRRNDLGFRIARYAQ